MYPSPARQIARKIKPSGKLANRYLWPDPSQRSADWVTGACVALRRKDFETIGGWPETHFLYFEDVELCMRARRRGLDVSVIDELRAIHLWKQESSSAFSAAGRRHATSAARYYASHPRELFRI